MFSWNTPIKLFPPQNVIVNSTYFSLYLYFCEFSSNSIFWSILRLGEEFFTRSSYDQNFFRIKKYEVRAFQRRVERICSPLQCWDILSWTSKSHSTLSFAERFHMRFLTMILGRKGVQMTLSKFPISNFTGVKMRSIGVDQSHQNHEKTLSQAKAFFAENDGNSY